VSNDKIRYFSVHIRGVTPLLTHNGQLADPLNPWSKLVKEVSKIRTKSDEDYVELSRREFQGGLYFLDGVGPVVPGELVEAVVKEGAKRQKKGKSVLASVFAYSEDDFDARFPLIYKGPKTRDELWTVEEKGRHPFRDIRGVKVGQSRVMRARARFNDWELKFMLQVFPSDLNPDEIERAIADAGLFVGLGDYRPKFGRFSLVSFKEVTIKDRAA
jgi:hypothetical protein